MRIFRRKKYLVNKPFQVRFALFFIFEAAAVLFLTLLFIYHLNNKYTAELSKLQYDNRVFTLLINSFVGTELAEENSFQPFQKEILTEVMIFAVALFTIVLIPSIIASHRIAGPLYRLNKTMRDVSRGLYTQRMAFRKRDAFKDIESSFNDMLSSLNYRKSIDLQDIDNMIQKIIFMIKKNQSNSEVKLDAHEIRDILLKMKKRKMYND